MSAGGINNNNNNIQFLETHNTIKIVSMRVKSKYVTLHHKTTKKSPDMDF